MGHAYLVAAHHQMQLLQILLHLIDDERNEIYLHVDKKCKEFKEEEFRQTVKKAKIHFIERRSRFLRTFRMLCTRMVRSSSSHRLRHILHTQVVWQM